MKFASMVAVIIAATTLQAAGQRWAQLPRIPDREGFAGAFAGVIAGKLVIAGGANIPGEKWGDSFTKVWYDDVYLLDGLNGDWVKAGKLPKPNGYGVSISTPEGLICVGGGDASQNFADVVLLTLDGKAISSRRLPSLPSPCAMMCGVAVGNSVYVAGGIARPDSVTALRTFWALDLGKVSDGWRELPAWPGPERVLAVAAASSDQFYLFSGARLREGSDGKATREYLRDAWSYTAEKGWKRLADLPRAAVAAPSPAATWNGRIHIFSGDDGASIDFAPLEKHPGFPRETLIYDSAAEVWQAHPGLPFSRATAPVVSWQDRFVIPNGEVRPRVRTPEVWALSLP